MIFRDFDEIHNAPSFIGFVVTALKGAASCIIPHIIFYPFDVLRTRLDDHKDVNFFKHLSTLPYKAFTGLLFFPGYMAYRAIYFSAFFTIVAFLEHFLEIELTPTSFDITEHGLAFAIAYVSVSFNLPKLSVYWPAISKVEEI